MAIKNIKDAILRGLNRALLPISEKPQFGFPYIRHAIRRKDYIVDTHNIPELSNLEPKACTGNPQTEYRLYAHGIQFSNERLVEIAMSLLLHEMFYSKGYFQSVFDYLHDDKIEYYAVKNGPIIQQLSQISEEVKETLNAGKTLLFCEPHSDDSEDLKRAKLYFKEYRRKISEQLFNERNHGDKVNLEIKQNESKVIEQSHEKKEPSTVIQSNSDALDDRLYEHLGKIIAERLKNDENARKSLQRIKKAFSDVNGNIIDEDGLKKALSDNLNIADYVKYYLVIIQKFFEQYILQKPPQEEISFSEARMTWCKSIQGFKNHPCEVTTYSAPQYH